VADLTAHTFSLAAIGNRYRAGRALIPRWMNLVRAVSSEGFGRLHYYTNVLRRLDHDRQFRRYFEQETTELPPFYLERIRRDLGPLWEWLPEGALEHDPNVFQQASAAI
jgi:hypothetical protein